MIGLALIAAAAAAPRAVVAPSGLRLRSTPDSGGAIVVKLPFGARVEVLESGPQVREGGQEGRWVAVTWGDQSGYLFDRWLSVYPPPPAGCDGLASWAEHALGEPQRIAVRIQPEPAAAGSIVLTRRDHGAIQLRQIEDGRGRTESLSLPGVGLAEGWLIVSSCLRRGGEPVLEGPYPRAEQGGAEVSRDAIRARGAGYEVRLTRSAAAIDIEVLAAREE